MTRCFALATALVSCAQTRPAQLPPPELAALPNTLTAGEVAAGWKLLFDGKTTDGWRSIGKTTFPDKGWSVQDGALVHAKGGGDIVTVDEFSDFELTWEWKVGPAANSGLKYNLPDHKRAVGSEYQLLDEVDTPPKPIGKLLHSTGGLYDVLEPAPDRKQRPRGEWNASRIVVQGNHVQHWLNGVKTLEYEFGSEALLAAVAKSKFKNVPGFGMKTKSPILLQDHPGEIAFRSIKVRVTAGR
jgi:hypothetical protein